MAARFRVVATLRPPDHDYIQYGVTAVGDPLNRTWMIAEEPDGYWIYFARDVVVEVGDDQERVPQWLIGGPAQRDGDVLHGTLPKGTFTAEGTGPSIFIDPGPRAGDKVELAPWTGRHVGYDVGSRVDLRDELGPAKEFVFEIEQPRRGDIELFVEYPSRGSNGAATTYLYDVSARNEGQTDETVRVSVSAPQSWVVRAPYEVEVPAGQTVVFPVAVSVPFGHRHGTHESATIQTTASDGTQAQADVHVYWHDPPQPGGHHSQVALKVAFGHPRFDTAPATTGVLTPWSREHEGAGPLRDMRSTWWFGLSPSRSVGLDFDSAGAVTGETTFTIPEASDIRLTRRLQLREGPTVIASQVHEATWEAGSHLVAWKMPIAPGIDRFAPAEGGNLEFEFVLEHVVTDPSAGVVGSTAPRAEIDLEDNWFHLPLSDYHEEIDLNAIGAARLSLRTPDAGRLVNPEEVAVIPFHVANHASAERRLEWALDANVDWITMGAPPTRLGAGQNASFNIVAEPCALPDGTVAQVLVIARDVETGIESFGRVAVTVTTGQDLPDERRLLREPQGGQQSPLPIGLALVAIWLAVRRR